MSLAAAASVLGTLVYLALASQADVPETHRPQPIVVETRDGPARERGNRDQLRDERRDPPAARFTPAPSPAGPLAPQAQDKDDVDEDDAADDVGADD